LDYRVMDTQIFNLGLSVHASSAYILVCALVGDGVAATDESLQSRWNASPEELQQALAELEAWRVLEKAADPEGRTIYAPNPASLWRTPGSPQALRGF
jgi:hypothetical protein